MKGITHFMAGVAVATFFPEVVGAAAGDLAFGPLLGGLAGLLPDTLDFKLLRFLERRDLELDPADTADAEGRPDPQALAEGLAAAVARAHAGGQTVRLQLHTLRLRGDLWRRWILSFDRARDEVVVRVGPAVTTGQMPLPGSAPAGPALGRAPLPVPVLYDYDDEIAVDILAGPSLALAPVPGAVRVTFLPWHRAGSHSLLMVLLLGAAGWLLAPVLGLVMALAALAHVVLDQLGSMGSELWFPLDRRRVRGLGLIRSGDALPNLATVWAAGALILWNLDRHSAEPQLAAEPILLLGLLFPCLALAGLALWRRVRRKHPAARRLSEAEALAAGDGPDE